MMCRFYSTETTIRRCLSAGYKHYGKETITMNETEEEREERLHREHVFRYEVLRVKNEKGRREEIIKEIKYRQTLLKEADES